MIGQRTGTSSRRAIATSAATTSRSRWKTLKSAKTYLAGHGCKVMDGPIVLDQGPCATTRVNYVLDPFGNQLELVEYTTQAFEASAPVRIYRP